MKITKMEIHNYRSCSTATFLPHPNLSVLIGPNGSGKTNILSAIQLLKKLAKEEPRSSKSDSPTAESKLKVWFQLNDRTAILTAKIHSYTDERNLDVIVSSSQRWYLKDFTGNAKLIALPLSVTFHDQYLQFYKTELSSGTYRRISKMTGYPIYRQLEDSAVKPVMEIAEHLSKMRYYSASQFTNPSNCPVSFEIEKEGKRKIGIRLFGHSKFLFDLYISYSTRSKAYIKFFDIIGPNGIGLVDKIFFKDISTSSIQYSVRSGGRIKKRKREKSLIVPQFTVGKHELSPNQLSEGTFKTITLLFYLIREESSILLIEEPEVCVHHGLLNSIMGLINVYSQDKQIVVSTHSDFVLDQVAPENVFQTIFDPQIGTTIQHITNTMSSDELSALRDYLESEGNLGEYWRHGALEE